MLAGQGHREPLPCRRCGEVMDADRSYWAAYCGPCGHAVNGRFTNFPAPPREEPKD